MPLAQAARTPEEAFYEPSAPRQIWFHYQHETPPGYAPNDVVEIIKKELDPLFVLLWVRTVYLMPTGEIEMYWRQAAAVGHPDWCEKPDYDLRAILTPAGAVRPHRILDILEGAPDPPWSRLPGRYDEVTGFHLRKWKQLGWLFDKLADVENSKSKQQTLDIQSVKWRDAILKEIKDTEAYWRAESDYRWETDWAHMMKLANALTSEERDLVAKVEGGRRNRIGHQLPPGVKL